MKTKVLFVKKLPVVFDEILCKDFFEHVGAKDVRFMGKEGKFKNCAFVEFKTEVDSEGALKKLHQLELCGSILNVEYCKNSLPLQNPPYTPALQKPLDSKELKLKASMDKLMEEKIELTSKTNRDLNALSSNFGFQYPLNPNLFYSYPEPTPQTLFNIMNTLASVPKFYTQVLHLMNKMNLPPPFSTPLPISSSFQNFFSKLSCVNSENYSDNESEYESENDSTIKRKRVEKEKLDRKKLKLQLTIENQMQQLIDKNFKKHNSSHKMNEIFDQLGQGEKSKKIDLKINQILPKPLEGEAFQVEVTTKSNGFGKINPGPKKQEKEVVNCEKVWSKEQFVDKSEMWENRLKKENFNSVSAFKNYTPGRPSSRLYLKNLSKSVSEKDLHLIFGRYLDWEKESDITIYDIRLMTEGRMKGQAFISLPSELQAQQALEEVNGCILKGKPIAVHFARSAKPKE